MFARKENTLEVFQIYFFLYVLKSMYVYATLMTYSMVAYIDGCLYVHMGD